MILEVKTAYLIDIGRPGRDTRRAEGEYSLTN